MKKERKNKSFLDKPFYEGGSKALKDFVDRHLVYPPKALLEGVKGSVVIKYTIDYQGKVIETKVVSGFDDDCDKAAQDVVRQLKFKVGSYRNIKVLFHKTLRIHFHANPKAKATPATKPKTSPVGKQQPLRNITYTLTQSKSESPIKVKIEKKPGYSYKIKINS